MYERKNIMKNGMIVNEFRDKRWYKNDLLHRTDGPAVIYFYGPEYWYFKGQLHRANGPAVTYADGYKAWWFEGKLHRTDGPARIESDGHKEYWLNDKWFPHKEWLTLTKKSKTQKKNSKQKRK
jgi:hypothetical protein